MALPLILGLAGSGAAGAGLLGAGLAAQPFLAGAIGSGLGSLLQGDDLGTAVGTGLLSYFGGKALGGAFGGTANPADALPQAELLGSAGDVASSSLGSNMITSAGPVSANTAISTAQTAADAATSGLSGAAGAFKNPFTLGAVGVPALMEATKPPKMDFNTDSGPSAPEAEAAKRRMRDMPMDYRPGIDPEFNFFQPMQEGGIADLDDRSERLTETIIRGANRQRMLNDKELISSVADVIKSVEAGSEATDGDKQTLSTFLLRYGEEALNDLVEKVRSGEFDQNAMVEEGMVNGAGDGMDDMIPATLEGEQDVVLSDGEFIVPADVVSGLGNGSSDAGAEALYEMMDRVREMRTGMTEQPEQVPQGMMLPV